MVIIYYNNNGSNKFFHRFLWFRVQFSTFLTRFLHFPYTTQKLGCRSHFHHRRQGSKKLREVCGERFLLYFSTFFSSSHVQRLAVVNAQSRLNVTRVKTFILLSLSVQLKCDKRNLCDKIKNSTLTRILEQTKNEKKCKDLLSSKSLNVSSRAKDFNFIKCR